MILPQAFADHRAAAPETIRVAAAVLPAGDHTIEVQAVGSSTRSHTITVAIPLAAATDIVTIFSPKYMKGTLRLTVKATSSAQPNAVLTVLGYGTVTYNAKKEGRYVSRHGGFSPGHGDCAIEQGRHRDDGSQIALQTDGRQESGVISRSPGITRSTSLLWPQRPASSEHVMGRTCDRHSRERESKAIHSGNVIGPTWR